MRLYKRGNGRTSRVVADDEVEEQTTAVAEEAGDVDVAPEAGRVDLVWAQLWVYFGLHWAYSRVRWLAAGMTKLILHQGNLDMLSYQLQRVKTCRYAWSS